MISRDWQKSTIVVERSEPPPVDHNSSPWLLNSCPGVEVCAILSIVSRHSSNVFIIWGRRNSHVLTCPESMRTNRTSSINRCSPHCPSAASRQHQVMVFGLKMSCIRWMLVRLIYVYRFSHGPLSAKQKPESNYM